MVITGDFMLAGLNGDYWRSGVVLEGLTDNYWR
jgi:hypothetical protein